MQRVIDIPDTLYTKIQNGKADKRTLETVILHGTPLPKGHGRLIEVTPQLEQRLFEYERYTGIDECPYEDAVREIDYAPTIIEAESEET